MKAFLKAFLVLGALAFVSRTEAVMYLARPYDPNLARWITRDPLGEDGGQNLYGFVGNNPVDLTDPFGLCCCCVEELYVDSNLIDKRPGLLGGVYKYDITVNAGLGYKCSGKDGDCTLKWTEENFGDSTGLMYTPGGLLAPGQSWTGNTFDGWKPKSKCPGAVTASMPTPHGFAAYWRDPPRTGTSHLASDVTVYSSDDPNCNCKHKQMRVRIETRLRLVNSVPDNTLANITITYDPPRGK
jgi:RHS repeat-associated protein